MPPRWFLTTFQEWASPYTYHFTATTDVPCHLWLRWSLNPPCRHPKSRTIRGLNIIGDVYYCFTAYHDVEQNEPGDTINHTFDVSDWPECQNRWFYFHGTTAGVEAPSQSPIFGRHLWTEEGEYDEHLLGTANDALLHGGSFFTWPSLPPPCGVVGRWQTPGQKEGVGYRFTNFHIPTFAEIVLSFLELTCLMDWPALTVHSRIRVENNVNPANFYNITLSAFMSRFLNSNPPVNWDNMPPWFKDQPYQSPSFNATIQPLVLRPDWVSGNPIVIFWEDFDQRTPWWGLPVRWAYNNQFSVAFSPRLFVRYKIWSAEEIT